MKDVFRVMSVLSLSDYENVQVVYYITNETVTVIIK
jgi:hypothetical protein